MVSNIGDYYKPQGPFLPWVPNIGGFGTTVVGTWTYPQPQQQFTPEEVEALKKLLGAALTADKVFGEEDCEDPEKVEWLKSIGIDLEEIKKKVNEVKPYYEWDGFKLWCVSDGKFLGEIIQKINFEYDAHIGNGEFIGHYKDEKSAKKAVVIKINHQLVYGA